MKTLNFNSDISELIELFKQHDKDIFQTVSYEIIFDDLLGEFNNEIPVDKIDVDKLAKKYQEYDSFCKIYLDYEGQSALDRLEKSVVDYIKRTGGSKWEMSYMLSDELDDSIKSYLNSNEIRFYELSTGKILVRHNND